MTILKVIGLSILVLCILFIGFIVVVAYVSDAGFKARDEEAMKIIKQQKEESANKTANQ